MSRMSRKVRQAVLSESPHRSAVELPHGASRGSSRASFRASLSFRRALPKRLKPTPASCPCSLLHEYRTREGTRALQSRSPHVNAGRGKLLSYGYPAVRISARLLCRAFFFYKIPSQHARHRPMSRFRRVLDFHPTSNGRPAVFYDMTVSSGGS
jgi:hypothetical protein